MSTGTRSMVYGFAPWLLVFVLAASNTLLIKQNLEMRNQHKTLQQRLDPTSWSLRPGESAQPFTARDLNGEQYAVDYQGGRHRVFLFFTPECPYCAQQVPFWRDLLDNIDHSRYEVVGMVGEREDRQKIGRRAVRR